MDTVTFPFVSVIVPVLNSAQKIEKCIEALINQSYPKDQYEIIIVDNGSEDDTAELITKYPVKFLVETSRKSPYIARNKGLLEAKGEIIALTDSDCLVVPNWIENGVNALVSNSAHLVGGHVSFAFSKEKTAAEIVDSLTNLEVENNVQENGVAKTGNLFVHREVFESIGNFPGHLRSGGDVLWTGRATQAGFQLIYSRETEVLKSARKLKALLKKQFRVGRGKSFIHIEQNRPLQELGLQILARFRPCRPSRIQELIQKRGTPDMEDKLLKLWVITCLCLYSTNLGRMSYVLDRWLHENSQAL